MYIPLGIFCGKTLAHVSTITVLSSMPLRKLMGKKSAVGGIASSPMIKNLFSGLTSQAMSKILDNAIDEGMMTADQANEIIDDLNSGNLAGAATKWFALMKQQPDVVIDEA